MFCSDEVIAAAAVVYCTVVKLDAVDGSRVFSTRDKAAVKGIARNAGKVTVAEDDVADVSSVVAQVDETISGCRP